MKRAVASLCLLLGGCAANVAYHLQWGAAAAGAGAVSRGVMVSTFGTGSTDAAAGAVLVGAMAAGSMHYYWRLPDGTRAPYFGTPAPDPARRINVQDCTRPVDPYAGNLMCK